MEKACWTCLYETPCSWEPAGEKDCCPDWKPESGHVEKMLPKGMCENTECQYYCKEMECQAAQGCAGYKPVTDVDDLMGEER